MRIAIVDDLKTERALLKDAYRSSWRFAVWKRIFWDLKAARLFSRQKKSGAFRPRFSIFTWRA